MLRRLLLLVLAAVAGCSVKTPSVALSTICAPDDAVACTFSSTCSAQFLGLVSVDVAVTQTLLLFIEVHNQADNNADPAVGRINTHDAYLQQVDISYSGGALAIPGTVERMQSTVPAEGTAVVGIFPIPASAGLTAGSLGPGTSTTVLATIKVKGIFGDGTTFEAPDYEVPVEVCNGCHPTTVCVDDTTTPPTIKAPKGICPQDGQRPYIAACQ